MLEFGDEARLPCIMGICINQNNHVVVLSESYGTVDPVNVFTKTGTPLYSFGHTLDPLLGQWDGPFVNAFRGDSIHGGNGVIKQGKPFPLRLHLFT